MRRVSDARERVMGTDVIEGTACGLCRALHTLTTGNGSGNKTGILRVVFRLPGIKKGDGDRMRGPRVAGSL
jgi:hypothetical protein